MNVGPKECGSSEYSRMLDSLYLLLSIVVKEAASMEPAEFAFDQKKN